MIRCDCYVVCMCVIFRVKEMASAQPLDEVTECPICTEVYVDPRVLPCIHTYCLKCIEGYSIDKKPGDKLPCPLCRKEFVIPSNGLAELPKNFFVNKLLHVKEISTVELNTGTVICDVCSHEKSTNTESFVAAVYCVECQEKLCKLCAEVHKNQKLCKSHNTVAVGDKLAVGDIFTSFPPPPCEKHCKNLLRFYCFDCRVVMCMTCFIETHSSHECYDVNTLIEGFQNQITEDVNSIAAGVDKCQSLLENVLKEKNEFISQAAQTELEMNDRTEKLKLALDHNRKKLVSDVELAKQKRISDVESVEEEIKQHIMMMEGFTTYAALLQQKGSAFELAIEAAGLHNKADELLVLESIGQAVSRLSHVDLSLKPTVNDENLIGEILVLKDHQGRRILDSPDCTFSISFVAFSMSDGQQFLLYYNFTFANFVHYCFQFNGFTLHIINLYFTN